MDDPLPDNENDTVPELLITDAEPEKSESTHSPARAAIMSALLPGAGQAYNRKYWKIPIIYAGFGGLGYAVYFNTTEHNRYRDAIKIRLDEDSDKVDEFEGVYTTDNLLTLKNYYRRNMDLAIAGTILFYVLNILDATVDAHLFDFDISDDLTFRLFQSGDTNPYLTASQGLQQPVNFSLRWRLSR